MKSLKQWFVFVMTLILVIIVFVISDFVVAGVIALAVYVWNKLVAVKVFKLIFCLALGIQCGLTFLVSIKSVKEMNNSGS